MMTPTSGIRAHHQRVSARFFSAAATDLRGLAHLAVLVVGVGDAVGAAGSCPRRGEPFFRQMIASRRTATFGSRGASSCSSGRMPLTSPGLRPREALERDQRRAARGRALVLEPAPQELELLPEAELRDRAVGLRADAVVAAARGGLELVVPLAREGWRAPSRRRRPRERVRVLGGLGERHATVERERAPGPTYRADGRISRPSRFCSRMCADQPAVRESANIAGASGGGISATSSTTADQNSTFVASTRSGERSRSAASADLLELARRRRSAASRAPWRCRFSSRARGSSAR